MLLDPAFISLVLIGFIGAFFLFIFLLPYRRSEEEAGLTPLYQERCSIRKRLGFGLLSGANLPICRVSFYEDFMVITFMGRTRIPYSEIENVEYKRRFFSKGIQIKYRNQGGTTSLITLFTKHPRKILEILGSKVKSAESTVPL